MFKNKQQQRDEVFAKSLSQIPQFQFDERVTEVFEDMIQRSVPGYDLLIYLIGLYTHVFVTDDSTVYDLGCSTGVATCMVASINTKDRVDIVALDRSEAMIKQCRCSLKKAGVLEQVRLVCADVNDVVMSNASMVILNLTLQFVEPNKRKALLHNVFSGLNTGGVLVLSEKVVFADNELNTNMIELHQAFKKTQGYSELEISQKRTSLENILIPDTIEQHVERLKETGFKQVFLCFQCLNFVSFLAIK